MGIYFPIYEKLAQKAVNLQSKINKFMKNHGFSLFS